MKKSRITPACAGNSSPTKASPRCWRDHPRVCGEQKLTGLNSFNIAGSPPRVRGTDQQARFWVYDERITPACAGNRHRLCFGGSP